MNTPNAPSDGMIGVTYHRHDGRAKHHQQIVKRIRSHDEYRSRQPAAARPVDENGLLLSQGKVASSFTPSTARHDSGDEACTATYRHQALRRRIAAPAVPNAPHATSNSQNPSATPVFGNVAGLEATALSPDEVAITTNVIPRSAGIA